MTPEQYWEGDNSLPAAFRKADEIRKDRLNEQLWYQGMYFYEALCDAAPLFRSFNKKGTKPHKYPSEPYKRKTADKKKQAEDEKKTYEKNREKMAAMVMSINKRFAAKGKEVRADADQH